MFRLAGLICVSLGAALAIWLLPASVHIVDWPPAGPVRVALFPPLWKLWTALGIAAAAAIAIGARHHRKASTGSGTLAVFSPLALLWLWTIPYLPWLPDRAPVLLALAGPVKWGVAALALCGAARAAIESGTWRPRPIVLPGRRAIFTTSLALYLGFGLWSAAAVGPGADEPHYLVITQSLLRDHDLAIENNHTRGDYREYFWGELRPDFLRRGLGDVIYSIHAPGLPALLVPAYAVAGYWGAVIMLCVFAALAARAVFDLAQMLAGRNVAWITWAAVCCTVPFMPHSWLIFPEIPGALAVAWAALWLHAPLLARARTWIWRGVALAALPWLHTKFVILLAAMGALLILRLRRQPKAVVALVTPAVISVVLWLFSFYRLYGVLDPQVPYGDFPRLYVLFSNIPRGVLGLLFDQKFGLLVYAPVYLIAPAGYWMMLRRSDLRWFALALSVTVVAFVTSSARMYMWWGGSSAPARFLVPVLPLLAPMIAVALRHTRSAAGRATVALLLGASLLVAAIGVAWPERLMLFSAPHGRANMAEALQAGSPLSFALPTFTEEQMRHEVALLAPWTIAALVALALGTLAAQRTAPPAGFAAASAGLAAFIVGGAVLAGAPAPPQQLATAMRGRLALMRAYDAPALRPFDYAHRQKLDERRVLALGTIRLSRSSGLLGDDPRRLAGPFDLPPGRFTARITFGDAASRDGSAAVMLGNRLAVARREGPLDTTTRLAFGLPVAAAVWVAVAPEALATSAEQVDIVAESIEPRSTRLDVNVRAFEPIDGRADAYIAYADGATYPEGGVFWTRGTRAGTVLVAAGNASTLRLTLYAGPVGGQVRVIVDGQDRSVALSPDQTRDIEVALSPLNRLVPVTVEAPGSFRPADHDAGSTDRRWLGCQVRIGLR